MCAKTQATCSWSFDLSACLSSVASEPSATYVLAVEAVLNLRMDSNSSTSIRLLTSASAMSTYGTTLRSASFFFSTASSPRTIYFLNALPSDSTRSTSKFST